MVQVRNGQDAAREQANLVTMYRSFWNKVNSWSTEAFAENIQIVFAEQTLGAVDCRRKPTNLFINENELAHLKDG